MDQKRNSSSLVKSSSYLKNDPETRKVSARNKDYKKERSKRENASSDFSVDIKRLPKRNTAQNRLNKLRAELAEQIKVKEKVENVGLEKLVNDTVEVVDKDNRSERCGRSGPSSSRNSVMKVPKVKYTAADRLKNFRKKLEIQKREGESTSGTSKIYGSARPSHREKGKERISHVKKSSEDSQKRSPLVIETFPVLRPELKIPKHKSAQNSPVLLPELENSERKSNVPVVDDEMAMEVDLEPIENDSVPVSQSFCPMNMPCDSNVNFNKTVLQNQYDSTTFFTSEISKIREERMYVALHENFMSDDVEMTLVVSDGDVIIVVDTNIFLSHLKFLYELLNKHIRLRTRKSFLIVVPWLVIQEIDYAMKKNDDRLASQARKANHFINKCLKKKHPQFFGQSLADFKEKYKNAVSVDDFILQYCLQFVSLRNEVILLTDDTNLCTKAMVNQLTVYTKAEFQNECTTVVNE